MKLILIHGINQSGTDAATLTGEWIASLIEGGVDPGALAAANPEMAWYADILAAGRSRIQTEESAREQFARSEFVYESLRDMARAAGRLAAGMGDRALGESNGAQLARLAQSLNPSDQSPGAFAPLDIIDEIYDYLTKRELRKAIDDRVASFMVDQPMTIIAHSLGTLVAYRLLRDRGIACRRLITLGSPLSIPIVRKRLDGQFVYPATARDWHNFYDQADLVALGKPFPVPSDWTQRPKHKRVRNKGKSPHSSRGYLRTPEVSAATQEALTG